MFAPVLRAVPAICLLFALGMPAEAATPPREPVLRLNTALLKAMRGAAALGFEGRFRALSPVLKEVFHFTEMTRAAAGRHWKTLSAAQQGRLVDAFTRMSIATFAARFKSYSGERFEVTGERPGLRGTVVVKNQIVKSSGKIVPIHYLLRKFDGAWRIVDIYLQAKYSELAIKRSEYNSLIQKQGFEAFLRTLDGKFVQLRAKGGT